MKLNAADVTTIDHLAARTEHVDGMSDTPTSGPNDLVWAQP